MRLENKVVVVTGASGYLGRVIVASVLSEGGRVAALDIAPAAPSEGIYTAVADLTSYDSAVQAFQKVHQHHGRIDGVVAAAGGFAWKNVRDSQNLTEWDDLFSRNLKSCVVAAKCALPYLEQAAGGSIVCVGAAASLKASKGMGAYCASKAGVSKLCEALADEVRPHAIRVNAIMPSIIDTPANRAEMPNADFSRWVTVQELSNVIVFLLANASSGISGASILVNGRM